MPEGSDQSSQDRSISASAEGPFPRRLWRDFSCVMRTFPSRGDVTDGQPAGPLGQGPELSRARRGVDVAIETHPCGREPTRPR